MLGASMELNHDASNRVSADLRHIARAVDLCSKRFIWKYGGTLMESNLDTSDQVLVALRRIIRAVDLHSRKLAKRYGLTGPQIVLLKGLAHLGEVPVGKLAKEVSLSHATVTDILARLEKRGLVLKTRDNADRRRVLAKLTDSGLELLKNAPSLLQERFIEEFGELQDWEQTLILSSLQRIAVMMEAEKIDAAPVLVSGPLLATVKETTDAMTTELPQPDKKEQR